jgi:hypothetical protein
MLLAWGGWTLFPQNSGIHLRFVQGFHQQKLGDSPTGPLEQTRNWQGCDSEQQYRVALAPHSEARATALGSAQSRRFDPELLVLSLGADVNVGPSGLVPCLILYSPWPDSVEMRTSPESCGLWSTAKIFQKANVQTALYFLETKIQARGQVDTCETHRGHGISYLQHEYPVSSDLHQAVVH